MEIDRDTLKDAVIQIEEQINSSDYIAQHNEDMIRMFGIPVIHEGEEATKRKMIVEEQSDAKRPRINEVCGSTDRPISPRESNTSPNIEITPVPETHSDNTILVQVKKLEEECCQLCTLTSKPKLYIKNFISLLVRLPPDTEYWRVFCAILKPWTLSDDTIYDLTTALLAEIRPHYVIFYFFIAVLLTKCRLLTSQASRMLFKTIELCCAKQAVIFIDAVISRIFVAPLGSNVFEVKSEVANTFLRICRQVNDLIHSIALCYIVSHACDHTSMT